MRNERKGKFNYSITTTDEGVEIVRSHGVSHKKIVLSKTPDGYIRISIYINSSPIWKIEYYAIIDVLSWVFNNEKLHEYVKNFGVYTVVQKITKELSQLLSEYLKF